MRAAQLKKYYIGIFSIACLCICSLHAKDHCCCKTGPQGPQGIQGPQGPMGPQGVPGSQTQGIYALLMKTSRQDFATDYATPIEFDTLFVSSSKISYDSSTATISITEPGNYKLTYLCYPAVVAVPTPNIYTDSRIWSLY